MDEAPRLDLSGGASTPFAASDSPRISPPDSPKPKLGITGLLDAVSLLVEGVGVPVGEEDGDDPWEEDGEGDDDREKEGDESAAREVEDAAGAASGNDNDESLPSSCASDCGR